MDLAIRDEQPSDIPAIRNVNVRAFGGEHEANIVDALRSNGGAMLSLVASAGGTVVGHIMYSLASIGEVRGAGLAPMAVLPEYQRQGVGGEMMTASIRRLTDTGCPFIIVLGHPEYYPRFGYVPASSRAIRCEWDVPHDAFMVLVLDEAKMRGVAGVAKYREEFSTVA